MKYVESLNQALHELLARDDRIFLIGEDILDPYGGAFKVSNGLSTCFPERVLTTPLSEAALIGMAGGMALRGLKPIVEIMFGDFTTLGMDQIVNHLTKYRVMYAGKVDVPVVIRTPMGGGRGYGPTHSQSLEKMFFGIPHLKVVCASRLHLPGELLKAALTDGHPVLFIEHKLLYPSVLVSPENLPTALSLHMEGSSDFPVAILRNYSLGQPDVSVITYGGMTRELEGFLSHLLEEEIKAQFIVPSLLNQVDYHLLDALTRNSPKVIWEEGTQGFDWGAEILSSLYAQSGSKLGIVHRLATLPTVIPSSRLLEKTTIPGLEKLEEVICSLIEQTI